MRSLGRLSLSSRCRAWSRWHVLHLAAHAPTASPVHEIVSCLWPRCGSRRALESTPLQGMGPSLAPVTGCGSAAHEALRRTAFSDDHVSLAWVAARELLPWRPDSGASSIPLGHIGRGSCQHPLRATRRHAHFRTADCNDPLMSFRRCSAWTLRTSRVCTEKVLGSMSSHRSRWCHTLRRFSLRDSFPPPLA